MATIQEFGFQLPISPIEAKINAAKIWQNNNAQSILSLITQKAEWYKENYDDFWAAWYDNVFNLETANDFGVAVWAIILNLPIQIAIDIDLTQPYFGFGPDTGSWSEGYGENFNYSNFSPGGLEPDLTLEEKRFLLRCRYFSLITKTNVLTINPFLAKIAPSLGGSGATIYAIDHFNMTIEYVFNFTPSGYFNQILYQYDILPRPAGVKLIVTMP